jgi:hypothetical protein
MKVEERYYNTSRPNQIVKLVSVDSITVEYKVEQATSDNTIKQFKCAKERFKNLYRKIELSQG